MDIQHPIIKYLLEFVEQFIRELVCTTLKLCIKKSVHKRPPCDMTHDIRLGDKEKKQTMPRSHGIYNPTDKRHDHKG
jgi:hypothetical protein